MAELSNPIAMSNGSDEEPAHVTIPQENANLPQADAEVSQDTPSEGDHGPRGANIKKTCGVCNEQQAKYKCSRCEIPYCSVACATLHRAIPCEATAARSPPRAPEPAAQNGSARPLPGTVAAAASGNVFSVLENSQKLQTLFMMFPRLRSQLRDVYNATLPPTDDARTFSAGYDAAFQQSQRGRGGRGGGRGGSGRQQGPWNSDRGTQEGIDALSRAKLEYGKGGESVREYANLVLKLVAADGVDVAQLVQDEVTEENAKIIAQLLSGDPY